MASATTRPSFTFMITQPSPPPKPLKHHHHLITFPPLSPKNNLSISSLNTQYTKLLHPTHQAKSIDVSKEDKPTSPEPPIQEETPSSSEASAEGNEPSGQEQQEKFDKRRLEEKFAVLNTGIYECRSCGYRYDEAVGDPSYPIPPGLPFDRLPDDWRCTTCGASKSFFQSKSVEIAGFAQNQQFGLGGNALTSGQKAVLIYGGLFLGFLFFLSGYFLQ